MKRIWVAALAALTTIGLCAVPASAAPGDNHAHDDPFTAARTAWWRGDRFGMFIHFGDYSNWQGVYTKPDGTTCQNAEWILQNCQIPMKEYEAKAATFDPAAFDATKIVSLAKAAGQRYIVITAKHHDGYAMWPTKVNTWNLRDHSAFDRHRDCPRWRVECVAVHGFLAQDQRAGGARRRLHGTRRRSRLGAVSRSGDKLYASVYAWGKPLHLTARSKFTITTPPPLTATPGAGLTAQYWPNATFKGKPAVTRVDPTLNFAWQRDGSPAPSIPVGPFSARWTGSIQAPTDDNYTLETISDDTAQVWIDGKLVIDASKPHNARVDKAVVPLTAGRHTIRVDYTQTANEAYLKLLWSSPTISQRIIPAGQLYLA